MSKIDTLRRPLCLLRNPSRAPHQSRTRFHSQGLARWRAAGAAAGARSAPTRARLPDCGPARRALWSATTGGGVRSYFIFRQRLESTCAMAHTNLFAPVATQYFAFQRFPRTYHRGLRCLESPPACADRRPPGICRTPLRLALSSSRRPGSLRLPSSGPRVCRRRDRYTSVRRGLRWC